MTGTLLVSCDLLQNESGMPVNENIWVNGYLASWQHNPETELINSGLMRASEIDWSAITHLTYFSLEPAPDGTPAHSLDPQERRNFNSDRLFSIVEAAHANDTPVIFSVGGAGSYEGFQSSIQGENRGRFIETLHEMMEVYGFDGVNLNMAPIEEGDFNNYRSLVRELAMSFDTLRTRKMERPLLTVAALKSDSLLTLYSGLHEHLDQINFLTYEMAQPWRGWQAWHNSALHNRAFTFDESTTRLLPSVSEFVDQVIASGIPRNKIGITINFYGLVWYDVHLMDRWPGWPTQDMTLLERVPYSEIFTRYPLEMSEWDEHAKVPFLNLDQPRKFVTFENEESILRKVEYTENERLGGVMIWELGGGFIRAESPGNRDPLLKAVKRSRFQNRIGGVP